MQNYDCVVVGTRIKRAREMRKMTQEYISNQVGVNTQHISDIERGVVGLSVGTLMKICKVLDVSADYILFGDGASNTNTPFYDLIKNLNDKDKLFIEDFIKLYIKR